MRTAAPNPVVRALHGRLLAAGDRGNIGIALGWLVLWIALLVGAGLRYSPVAINSNLLALLPGAGPTDLLGQAMARSRNAFLRSLILAVSGPDTRLTEQAATAIRHRLAASGLHLQTGRGATAELLRLYRTHRFELLTPTDIRGLAGGKTEAFLARLDAGLAMPGSPAGTPADPGGFLSRYLADLPRPYPRLLPQDRLLVATTGREAAYLIPLDLGATALGTRGEARAVKAVATARKTLHSLCPACRLDASGPALYAAAERASSKREIGWLSAASTGLIVLIIVILFRSIRPLVLTSVSLAVGAATGAAATLLLFGQIHLLTLVLGTTLLGIAVDYAFHYLTDYRLISAPGTLVRIAPGLGLGLVTSLIAFAFLAATPFPALRQLATFSMAGLAAAGLTVFAWFPLFAGTRRPPPPFLRQVANPPRRLSPRWRLVLLALVVIAGVAGLRRLHATDDLRGLQNPQRALLVQTAAVNRLLGTPPSGSFFLVRGTSLPLALARSRRLATVVARHLPGIALLGLSGFIPSPTRQRHARAAWRQALGATGKRLLRGVRAAGLPTSLVTPLVEAWRQRNAALITPTKILAMAPFLKRLVIRTRDRTALLVPIYGHADSPTLRNLATLVPGVAYVNPLERLNATFTRIRQHTMRWVGLGYVLIFLLLLLRYGLRGSLAVMLPPLAAAGATLGFLGWIAQPVNVFVVVALMLVAGIGVDYAVFLREGAGHHQGTTRIAVGLATITTLASFGLLGASSIPVVHAFGLTVTLGIAISWLAAPLSLLDKKPGP